MKYSLDDIVEIISGGTPKTGIKEYWDGEIPWISIKDITSSSNKIQNTEKYVTRLGVENSSTNILKEGDIILTARGTVGEVGRIVKPMAFNQSCFGLRAKTGIVTSDFLYYKLKTIMKNIKNHSHGSVFNTINRETFKHIFIDLPSLEEQKRIGNILTALDDKIELNNQMNQTLEEIASLLYKRWFVDFEFPDDKGNPYKSSGGEMVDSELGMIPKGWEVKKLGEIELIITDFVSNGSFASLKANTKIYKEENYAVFVRNTDLKSGKFETYVDEKTYQFLSKSKLLGGEIIISNVGDVGSVFLCPRINKKMTLGNNVILVKSQESKIYWNYYLYIFLKSSLGKALLESITSGSAQMKFNKTDFKKLKFIAPNFNTLEEFNKIFDKNIFLQNNYKAENTKLQTMKKELLKELI